MGLMREGGDPMAFPERMFSVPEYNDMYCCSHIIVIVKYKEMTPDIQEGRDSIQGILSF